jgi:hypothetical protein
MAAKPLVLVGALFLVVTVAMPVTAQQLQFAPPAGEAGISPSALSAPWQQTLQTFEDWVQIQQLYTPQQTAEMRTKLLEKAYRLAPEESESFRHEIDAKLRVLMSEEARDARKWLASTLAVASDSYAQKIKAKLPDVVKESPNELMADLNAFESRQSNVKQYQQGLQETRQMTIKANEEDSRRQAEANAQAHVGSGYNPAPGGKAIGGPGSYQRYRSPYGPTIPYGAFGVGFRFW